MKKKKIIVSLLALSAMVSIAGCKTDEEKSSSLGESSTTVLESSTAEVPSTSDRPVETTISQDFSDVTSIADKPATLENGTLYLDSTTKGTVAVEGDTKFAKVTGGTTDTTLYMNLVGLDNGTVKIEFDFSLGGTQGSWTLFQVYGSSDKHSEAEVFSYRTAKDDSTKETFIGYRVDKDVSAPIGFDNQVGYTGNAAEWYHSEVFFDTATGNGTTKISKNGVEYSATFTDMIYEIGALKFMAKSTKSICVDNISVTHVQGEFSQVKAKRLADLDRLYATYEETKYTANYAAITAKYNEVKAALTAATDFDALSAAYGPGISAIKAFDSDAAIAQKALDAAKTTAKEQIKAKYDALVAEKPYTESEKEKLDADYARCIKAFEDSQDITEIEGMIETAIAMLESVPATGTGPVEVKKYEFNANDLTLGTCTDDFTVANFFNFVGLRKDDGSIKSKVDANNKTMDGIEFTQRFSIQGTTHATKGGYISFTLENSASLVVYAMSGSNGSERPIMVFDSLESLDAPIQQTASDGSALVKLECTLAAGTYYIGSSAGSINVYGIIVTTN